MVFFLGVHILLCLTTMPAHAAAQFRLYVATLDSESVTLAWGTTDGGKDRNTIGYAAPGIGHAVVKVGERRGETDKSWIRVAGLQPDTVYGYSVAVSGQSVAIGTVRTWARNADSLTFFVIGDFGNGKPEQKLLGQRMEKERLRLQQAGEPVRFVMTTGDNIYGFLRSGAADRDWEDKFYAPYAETLKSIPFYAVPGNHDGNESEHTQDLATYLDNFFFPSGEPRRWYRFSYGDLVEFFALDSTQNQPNKPSAAVYLPDSEQSKWLMNQLAQPALPWRLVVMHHPMFSAGPEHLGSLPQLRHWFEAFSKSQVQVVFAGHEHNAQISERNAATGGMQFVVSGAGAQLRGADIRSRMAAAHIAAWTPQRHFLVVRVRRDELLLTPVGDQDLLLKDPQGEAVPVPVKVPRQGAASAGANANRRAVGCSGVRPVIQTDA